MKKFLVALVVVVLTSAYADAQCSGGSCSAPTRFRIFRGRQVGQSQYNFNPVQVQPIVRTTVPAKPMPVAPAKVLPEFIIVEGVKYYRH